MSRSSSSFQIVRCTADDADALSLIGSATFLETFAGVLDGAGMLRHCRHAHSAATYRNLMAEGASIWLAVVEPGAAPIGYVVLSPASLPGASDDGCDLEIKRIYLLQRFQGHGLGRALMEVAEREARDRGAERLVLGVYAANVSAQAFYRRNGFLQIAQRKFSVGDTAYDDFIFAKPLHTAALASA